MSLRKTKYIVVVNAEYGTEIPYIFPNTIYHNEFARSIGEAVISAGFCYVNDKGSFVAYGKSESLRLESRPEEDSHLLTVFLTGNV